jgi:ribosomal protein S27AE
MTEKAARAVIRQRPFCAGCGMFFAVHGEHRGDCTTQTTQTKRKDAQQ